MAKVVRLVLSYVKYFQSCMYPNVRWCACEVCPEVHNREKLRPPLAQHARPIQQFSNSEAAHKPSGSFLMPRRRLARGGLSPCDWHAFAGNLVDGFISAGTKASIEHVTLPSSCRISQPNLPKHTTHPHPTHLSFLPECNLTLALSHCTAVVDGLSSNLSAM